MAIARVLCLCLLVVTACGPPAAPPQAEVSPTAAAPSPVATTPSPTPTAAPELITADIEIVDAFGGAPPTTSAATLVLAADGSHRLESPALSQVFDATTRTATTVTRPEESAVAAGAVGGALVRRNTGLGLPDHYPYDLAYTTTLIGHVRAMVRAGDPALTEVTVLDRPALRAEVTPVANELAQGPDRVVLVLDAALLVPLQLEAYRQDTLQRSVTTTALRLDEPPDGGFTTDLGADPPIEQDLGVEEIAVDEAGAEVALAEAAGLLGYTPPLPATVPDGYQLVSVLARPGALGVTGPEGSNPENVDVAQLVYRDGFSQMTVTFRRTGAAPAAWVDPLFGEGDTFRPTPITLAGGALAGATGDLVVGPETVPHLWARTAELVVTVAGAATTEELLAVAETLN